MESQGEVGGIQVRIIQEIPGADSARVYFINFHPLRMADEVTTKYYRYTRGQLVDLYGERVHKEDTKRKERWGGNIED